VKLNFSRGLVRLWVVLSVLWIGLVAVHAWSTFPAEYLITDLIRPDGPPLGPEEFGTPTNPLHVVPYAERRRNCPGAC
jgi:hypothetical protein